MAGVKVRFTTGMKIVVVGGNAGTGAQVVRVAAERGHEVTALSRSGSKELPEGAQDVKGNALDGATLRAAFEGVDAVVVTVGGAKGRPRHRTAVTKEVVEAMHETGVKRLIVQSSLGAGDSAVLIPGGMRLMAKTVLAKALEDHDEQEGAVMASGLEWTIVRPGGLNNRSASGKVVAQETTERKKMKGMISRADVAETIVDLLDDESAHCKALGLGTE